MAIRTVNGSIPLDENSAGNPDFPGKSLQLDGSAQVTVKKEVAQLIVTDLIVAPGGDVVDITSIV